jgi:Protein of unknown function (DUF1353)
MVSRFLTPLVVKQVSDTANDGRGLWELTQPLVYMSSYTGGVITVPAGFQTDFASVPRIPIAFLLCGDTASMPAVLHDWLYTAPHPVPDRAVADAIFKEAALGEGVPAWRVCLLWLGVRLGGAAYWD